MTKFVKLQGMKVIYLYTDVIGRPKNKKTYDKNVKKFPKIIF